MTVQEFDAAHRDERDAATIELELEPEELRALMQPAGRQAVVATEPRDGARSGAHKASNGSFDARARVALLLCTSAAAVLLAVGDARVAQVSGVAAPRLAAATATPLEQPTPLPKQHPVRFANPFDATEVFEFPASTSKSAARAAVAKVLTERARGRLYALSSKRARHHRSRRPHLVNSQTSTPAVKRTAVALCHLRVAPRRDRPFGWLGSVHFDEMSAFRSGQAVENLREGQPCEA